MVLNEAEQHGHDHLPLGVQVLARVRLVGTARHEQVVDDGLQRWNGCKQTKVLRYRKGCTTLSLLILTTFSWPATQFRLQCLTLTFWVLGHQG